MYTLLVFIASFISILLMIVVLMQASKGDGLSGTFGAAAGSMGSMFGTRRTADFLSKATWWLAGSLAVLALAINLFFLPGQATANQKESIIQSSRQQIPQSPTLPSESQPKTQTQSQPNNSKPTK
ncbi:MAG: preprotein translocase subunit SecG [Bacteroidetes bacterium]|nr:preprotein translocase subunit SecG [Bacteroidota bacterium]